MTKLTFVQLEVANSEFKHIYQSLLTLLKLDIITIQEKQELEKLIDRKIFTQFRDEVQK